jgi:hypothetical protein
MSFVVKEVAHKRHVAHSESKSRYRAFVKVLLSRDRTYGLSVFG